MTLVEIIGEKRHHQKIVDDADKKIVQRAKQLGIRNCDIDAVYELVSYSWKMLDDKVLVDWDKKGENFQELNLNITEYVNDGPIFIVMGSERSANDPILVVLNGRKLIGDLNDRLRIVK